MNLLKRLNPFQGKAINENNIESLILRTLMFTDLDFLSNSLYSQLDSLLPHKSKDLNRKRANEGKVFAQYELCIQQANTLQNLNEKQNNLRIAANNGHPIAQCLFGNTLDDENYPRYLKMAMNHGSTYAAALLLKFYGKDFDEFDQAIYRIKCAAENGEYKSLLFYGEILILSNWVPRNLEEGVKYLKKAMEIDSNSLDYLKLLISTLKTLKSDEVEFYQTLYDKKKKLLNENMLKTQKELADRGNIESQFQYAKLMLKKALKENLSQQNYNSKNMSIKNEKEGLKYLKLAADNGHAKAAEDFAMSQTNIDVKKKYLSIASKAKNPRANFKLSQILDADPDPLNQRQSRYFLENAVNLNDPEAMYHLGLAHLTGNGIEKDVKEGIHLIKRAARLKFPPAMKEVLNWTKKGKKTEIKKKVEAYLTAELTKIEAGKHENVFPDLYLPGIDIQKFIQ